MTAANRWHPGLGDWDDYCRAAENPLVERWRDVIWPVNRDFDIRTALECARALKPGETRFPQSTVHCMSVFREEADRAHA